MPRKVLQVHRTTLDPPTQEQNQEGLDFTTEPESTTEENNNCSKGIFNSKMNEKKKKVKRRYMPPELIVTSAQILENSDLYCTCTNFKEIKSKSSKHLFKKKQLHFFSKIKFFKEISIKKMEKLKRPQKKFIYGIIIRTCTGK